MSSISEKEELVNIGAGLRELRFRAGFNSSAKFAQAMGLHENTVYGFEQGKGGNIKTLINMLRIHDLSLADFFKSIHYDKRNQTDKS